MGENERDSSLLTRERVKPKKPRRYLVIMHNDHFTTMEFVVSVLVSVFSMPEQKAVATMLDIHQKGAGKCGVFAREIAETKISQVHAKAEQAGYPLRCTMEPLEENDD